MALFNIELTNNDIELTNGDAQSNNDDIELTNDDAHSSSVSSAHKKLCKIQKWISMNKLWWFHELYD